MRERAAPRAAFFQVVVRGRRATIARSTTVGAAAGAHHTRRIAQLPPRLASHACPKGRAVRITSARGFDGYTLVGLALESLSTVCRSCTGQKPARQAVEALYLRAVLSFPLV